MGNVSLGRAVLVLGAEIGSFVSDLGNAEQHAKKLKDAVSGLGKGLQTMGRETTAVGAAMSTAISLPLAAIGGAAIKMGMDVVESENLFAVSFDGMAEKARAWSTDLSDRLNLNEFELRRTSATLFTMFDSMGIGEQAAYDMGTSMTELAADMASFYNLDTDQAFEKLRAGITGEAEPLKALGILVDETTVKQTAMRNGLIKQGEEMSQQQKVLARYVSIMEQTSKAQGDLARTADSPSNKLKAMRAQAEETAAKLGIALLPAFDKVLTAASALVPKVQAVVDWFGKLDPKTQTVIIGIAGVAAAIGPVLVVAGTLISSVGTIVGAFSGLMPILATVGGGIAALGAGPLLAIIGAIGAVVLAWRNWDAITGFVSNTYNAVKEWMLDKFTAIVDGIREKVDAVKGFFYGMYDAVVGHSYVPDMIAGIKTEFGKLGGHMVTPAEKAAAKVAKVFEELNATLKAHTTEIKAVDLGTRQFTDALLHEDPAIRNLDVALAKMTTTVKPLYELIPSATQYLYDWAEAHERAAKTVAAVNQQLNQMPGRVKTAAEGWRSLGTSAEGVGGKIKQAFGGTLSQVNDMFVAAFTGGGGIGGAVKGLATSITSNLMGMIPVVGPFLSQFSGAIVAGLSKLGGAIKGFFSNIFGGPSKDELNGRGLVAAYEESLSGALSEQQKLEAGGDKAAQTIIALRDKYIEWGLTAEEAMQDAERLWASSRDGAEASARVIEEIKRKFAGGITVPVNFQVGGGGMPDISTVPVIPMANGTDGIVHVKDPALFYTAGNENAWFGGEGRRGARPSGVGGGGDVVIQIDRRTIARATLKDLYGASRAYGVV